MTADVLLGMIAILLMIFLYVVVGFACLEMMPRNKKCAARITLSFVPFFNFFYMVVIGMFD